MTPVAETAAVVGPPVFMHTVRGKSAPSAVVARWRHDGGEFDISPSDIVRVTFNLKDGVPIRHQAGRSPSHSLFATVGNVSVTPAHQRVQISVNGPADVLQLFLREAILEAAVDGPFKCSALFNSHDSEMQAAAMQLFVGATRGDPDDPLLLESVVHRVAAWLLKQGDREESGPAHGGLACAASRRVEELITAALDDTNMRSPTLDELADAARLSVNHFIRAFRQQTGVTPHRHLVLRRLERGVALLKRPGISIAEVADLVGFATPSHFVATFRRAMGVTPGELRTALVG